MTDSTAQIADLISESRAQSRTVHLRRNDVSHEMHLDLMVEADDSVLNGDVQEFWGSDWRIHIDGEETD